MLKHYVEFLYLGMIVTETSIEEVKSREPKKIEKIPDECFGFRFFDKQEITAENEKHEPETLRGEPKNYSGIFYFGRVMTLEEVKNELPDEKILIRNMETNNYNKVVKTRCGNFKPFGEGDSLIK